MRKFLESVIWMLWTVGWMTLAVMLVLILWVWGVITNQSLFDEED